MPPLPRFIGHDVLSLYALKAAQRDQEATLEETEDPEKLARAANAVIHARLQLDEDVEVASEEDWSALMEEVQFRTGGAELSEKELYALLHQILADVRLSSQEASAPPAAKRMRKNPPVQAAQAGQATEHEGSIGSLSGNGTRSAARSRVG